MTERLPQDAPVPAEEHPEAHEQSDISIKAVAWTFAIFVISAILIHVGLYWLFGYFERSQAELDAPLTAVERGAAVPIDRPRLQGIPGYHDNPPSIDMAEMEQAVTADLNSQGRLPSGGYHIPIDRAMDILIERNLLKGPTTRPATRSTGGHGHAAH